jgi:TP901 family phage tail tape measure protein
MNRDLSIAVRLSADVSRLNSGFRDGQRGVSRFADHAKREVASIARAADSLAGKLTGIGLAATAAFQIRQSAQLDQSLNRIKQTARVTEEETSQLRRELFAMSKQTGADLDQLKEGDAALIASGQSFRAALETTKAINVATTVTGANATTLAGALGVAGEAFQFGLERPGKALDLLDKMTAAGRLGNAELENLSDIFARIGVNSRAAGMGFSQSLAFTEGLSLIEKQPERLATLVDSTLRLFTNLDYLKEASKATGVRFFDKKGARRDAFDVLSDFKRQFGKLKTEKQRALFMDEAFGKADQDTVRGLRALFQGDSIQRMRQFTREIDTAGGTLAKDLPDALNNSVNQANRLKATLREAADGFAEPINKAFTRAIQFGLDEKKLTGEQIIGGGAATAVGGMLTASLGKGIVGMIGGKVAGLAGGVVAGNALETVGVQPVYVVNMPSGFGTSAIGGAAAAGAMAPKLFSKIRTTAAILGGASLSTLPMYGAGAVATGVGLAAGAGAAGYGIGTLISKSIEGTAIYDKIGESVARVLATFGNANAAAALEANRLAAESGRMGEQVRQALQGESQGMAAKIGEQVGQAVASKTPQAQVSIRITPENRVRVDQLSSRDLRVNVDAGLMGAGS